MTEVDWHEIDRFLVGEAWAGSRLDAHLEELCVNIGPRWASSEGERRAVEYIRKQMDSFGLADARLEEFDLDTWEHGEAVATATPDERAVEILPYQYCPPFEVEAALVDVGFGTERELLSTRKLLPDAIAVMSLADEPFTTPRHYAQRFSDLAEAGAAAAVVVDRKSGGRIEYHSPTDWREAEYRGHPLPTVATTREDGGYLRRIAGNGGGLRLRVESRLFRAKGVNTVAEVPGDRWPQETLLLGGHHDTVPNTPGGNDNASGTVTVMETARVVAALLEATGLSPGRTIRFATWSAEEQRLQGSYAHVRRHWPAGSEASLPRLVINLDELSTGTVKGLVLTFPHLRDFVQSHLDSMHDGYRCHVMAQLDPSSDHFPFARRGIDSSICWRWRFFGRHEDAEYHHEPGDTIDKVRPRELKEYVGFLARLLLRLSLAPPGEWPENPVTQETVEERLREEMTGVVRTM